MPQAAGQEEGLGPKPRLQGNLAVFLKAEISCSWCREQARSLKMPLFDSIYSCNHHFLPPFIHEGTVAVFVCAFFFISFHLIFLT